MTLKELAHLAQQTLHTRAGCPVKRSHVHELLAAAFGHRSWAAFLSDSVLADSGVGAAPTGGLPDLIGRAVQLGYEQQAAASVATTLQALIAEHRLSAVSLADLRATLLPAAQVADRDDLDDDDDDDDGIDDDDDEGWDDEPLRAAPPASGPAREQLMGSPMLLSTYKNAGPLLRGLSSEQTGILSPALAIRFQLPGRQNEHDLRFSFDHAADLPKRIAVVIGKNGVGKSQTLGRIARAALDGTAALTDGTDGGRPLINRLLAFAPTNEAESVFPTDKRKRPRIWYQRYSMNRSRRSRRNDYLSDLIVQVARSTQMVASNSRWEIFTEALSAITKADELHLPTRSTSSAYVPLAKLPQGAEQRVLERFASIDVKKEPTRVVAGEGYGPKFPPQWPYRTGAGAARSRERCISGVGTTTGRCDGAALS